MRRNTEMAKQVITYLRWEKKPIKSRMPYPERYRTAQDLADYLTKKKFIVETVKDNLVIARDNALEEHNFELTF